MDLIKKIIRIIEYILRFCGIIVLVFLIIPGILIFVFKSLATLAAVIGICLILILVAIFGR